MGFFSRLKGAKMLSDAELEEDAKKVKKQILAYRKKHPKYKFSRF